MMSNNKHAHSPMNFYDRTTSVQNLRTGLREREGNGTRVDDIIQIDRCLKPGEPNYANSLVFQGSLLHKAIFGKLVWRKVNYKGGANTERKLMENELEAMVQCGLTPCIPMRYASVELDFDTFMQTAMFRAVSEVIQNGPARKTTDNSVHILLMEDCGATSLSDFLQTEGTTEDIHAIVFMLFHALSWLCSLGISHNDMHALNIVLQPIEPTTVAFGQCCFRTSTLPYIIDWDLGRSHKEKNGNLVWYNYVGVFDHYNSLFDTIGLTKTLMWQHKHAYRSSRKTRAKSKEFQSVIDLLQNLNKQLTIQHPWVFNELLSVPGKNGELSSVYHVVQQTPYVPDKTTGIAMSKWPHDVSLNAPSLYQITEALFADMDEHKKHTEGTFSFPATARAES